MKRIQTYLHVKSRWERKSRPGVNRRVVGNQTFLLFSFLILLIFTAGIWLVSWQYSQITRNLPPVENLVTTLDPAKGIFARPTRLMDRSGTQVLAELAIPGVKRHYMSTNPNENPHISPDLINAVVASVQPDYWSSPGFTIRTFNPEEHPTVAQRLVFSLLLENEPPSLKRAIREKLLAAQVISRYGTERVMEWYLNSVDLGHYAYGFETASQTYMGKTSAELSLPEAAMLAGVSMAPALNPWDSADGAKVLQTEVLKQMAVQKMITPEIFKAALLVPVVVTDRKNDPARQWSDFTNSAIAQLSDELGRNMVERGGLLVQTTMDASLQQQAECVLEASALALAQKQDELVSLEKNCKAARLLPVLPPGVAIPVDYLSSGLVIQDPRSGQILADASLTQSDVGDLSNVQIPAGSLITPFIYLNGFAQGLSPASMEWDVPSDQISAENQGRDNIYHGPVRIRTALVNDYLIPADKVFRQTGWISFTRLAGLFGLNVDQGSKNNDPFMSSQASMIDMAGAYGILANSGVKAGAASLKMPGRIINTSYNLGVWDEQGVKVLDWSDPVSQPIVSPQIAYLMNNVLSDDLARAPSLGYPNILQLGTTAAAKMGVLTDGSSAWTAGYTPERVVVSWIGKRNGTGGSVKVDPRWAAGNWRAMMQYQTTGMPSSAWTEPPGLVHKDVCDPSGLLPTPDCPNKVPEVFISGSEPNQVDTLFQKVAVNYETGKLATVFTPADMVVKKVFMIIPAEYLTWAKKAGLPIPPESYDAVRAESTDPAVHFSSPKMFDYLRGKVSITGTASSQGFVSYSLEAGQGLNPGAWIQVGQTGTKPVIEGELAEWDTTGLNGLYALRLQVIGKDNVLKSSTIQVTVDNQPPKISVHTSVDPASISLKQTPQILISADITDDTGIVQAVILLDGKPVSTLDKSPYGFLWNVQLGKHTFQVKTVDMTGNEQLSEELIINVGP